MREYDVVVIGAGTAGQTAAYDLKTAGLSVVVVEKSDVPGGTCALYGCQPKKWYYEATEVIAKSRHLAGKGIENAPRGMWSTLRAEKSKFTDHVPESTVKGLSEAGIDLLQSRARFSGPHTLQVDSGELTARYIIIATGAKPMPLPFNGAEHLITSNQFLELETLPRRLVFVGGGFISFEFAHFAARLGPGDAHITILEAAPRPLGPFDAEMVELLMAASRDIGIDIRSRVTIREIDKTSRGLTVNLSDGTAIETDLAIHGAGRVPDLDGLDLESAAVAHTRSGISVGADMRTNIPHIFAVGDCAATVQLARVADYEAHVAAHNILSAVKNDRPGKEVDYHAVPSVLFTYPQYGMVGHTEDLLIEQGIGYRKSFGKELQWPTYRRINMTHAAYKLLVDADNQIVGAHFISDNAAGLINTIKQAMLTRTPATELYWHNIMSPYPSRESDVLYMLRPFVSG